MRKLLPVLLLAFVSTLPETSAAQSDVPLLLRFPTVSKTQIVFNYANDLWIVSRDGGDSHRLTSGVGIEALPYFSPDGSMIAFTGEYDGNRDVYVVPATGGIPRRLTYHPSEEYVAGWTPDGKKILFTSWSNSFMHFEDQIYTVPVDGGLPTQLPLPIAEDASYSPDGTHLACGSATQFIFSLTATVRSASLPMTPKPNRSRKRYIVTASTSRPLPLALTPS